MILFHLQKLEYCKKYNLFTWNSKNAHSNNHIAATGAVTNLKFTLIMRRYTYALLKSLFLNFKG